MNGKEYCSVNERKKRDANNLTNEFSKSFKKFTVAVNGLAKSMYNITGNRTDQKIVMKAFKKHIIPFVQLVDSWNRGQQKNPHLSESINEAIKPQGYSQLNTMAKHATIYLRDLSKALRKQDDSAVLREVHFLAAQFTTMEKMLKDKKWNAKYNESVNEVDISKIRNQMNKETAKIRHSYEMMRKYSGDDVKKANHWKDVGNKAKDRMNALQDRINAARKKESVNEARTINVEPNWEGMWRFFKRMAKTNPRDWKRMERTLGSDWKKIDKMAQQKGWKSESVNESTKRQYRDVYSKYYKTYEAFAREVMNLTKRISKISGDKVDAKIILKNFKKHVIPFAGLMNSWSKGRESNPHIDEGFGSTELMGKKDLAEFEKTRQKNAEVLGYKLTGQTDIKPIKEKSKVTK